MTRQRTGRRRIGAALGAAVLAALVLLPAAPASAHAYLTGSTPAAGTTLTRAPASVDLQFDETLLDLGSDAVAVTGPGGRHYETGCAAVDGRDVRVGVALGRAGTYTVAYRVVSADGHTVENAYTFRYAPTAAQQAGSATGPSCGAAAPIGRGATAGTPVVVLIAIGVSGAVLLGVLVLVVVIAVRVRRAAPASADQERLGRS